ncbi:ww oxidoreductase [Fusarium langsethiae]|uniref:3beta-hydroxysteroid 3-dehydrogenase n=1 Tax=Fusarium langsethiae TaxID=179993 RepID=A0A0M9EUQ3_FUSLA|nr:ww oxidoreductase [Fusarium langsethiae]GKU04599.1 unnamed protein product [Fusarium langsethiae]GKU20892.1 unnamed protein product [Fusarium langsethiae]
MPPSETGTVIITGANGSCATPFVSHLLTHYPSLTLLATVRNASPSDPNTVRLNDIISTSSQASIKPLDLASLSNVRAFAEKTAQRVKGGEIPPIKAIVCNACTMSLKEQVYTEDGFERTFQVNHLSHYLLVLKLLGSMSQDGRIVMLGSNTHYTDRPHPLFNMRVGIPKDVETLVKPKPDVVGKEYDHGFHRYGISKLTNIMFMHDLNAKLSKDPKLSGIAATAMDPGGMVDSRAHKIQTPLIRFAFGLIVLLLPILKYFTDELRSSAQSGQELVELAVGDKYQGAKGYFMGARWEKEDAICMDADKRDVLWKACWEWAGVKKEETVLGE